MRSLGLRRLILSFCWLLVLAPPQTLRAMGSIPLASHPASARFVEGSAGRAPWHAQGSRVLDGHFTLDLANESLIRDGTTHKIYLIWAGTRHRLNSSATLATLGLGGASITTVSEMVMQGERDGPSLRLRLTHGLVYPLSPIESGHARVTLSSPAAAAGATLTVQGTGFGANETVQLTFGGITAGVQTSGKGSFSTSVTIPSGSTPGNVLRLYAYGVTSGVFQAEPIAVIAPAPTPVLTTQPAVATQGSILQVGGSGFVSGEKVDIFLAQGVSAIEVTADNTGTFAGASLPVPVSLSTVEHTLIAFGLTSKLLASGMVLVTAPGVSPGSGTGSIVGAGVTLSRYTAGPGSLVLVSVSGFAAGETVSVSFNSSQVVTHLTDAQGTFSQIAFTIPSSMADGSYTVTVSGLTSKRTAHTSLRVLTLNPTISISPAATSPGASVSVQGQGFAAHEIVTLALNAQAVQTSPATVATSQTGTFNSTFSVPATAVAGANTLTATGASSRGMAIATLTANQLAQFTWYFAEGSTTAGNSTQLALLNPNNQVATVTCSFMFASGSPMPYTATVAAKSRATIDVGSIVGPGREVFTMLRSDQRIRAAQTVYRNGLDFSMTSGVDAPSTVWYLAEGYTGISFHEYLRVLNPNQDVAHVTVQLLPFNGRSPVKVQDAVAARSGLVVDVNALAPKLSLSAVVDSDQPIVVDRLMTFGAHGYGATAQAGSTTPAGTWLFAEASTLNNFETYFTVLNPSSSRVAVVNASFYDQSGTVLGNQTIRIDPRHRGNIKLNDTVHSSGIATIMSSTIPVVAERALYFGAPNAVQAAAGGSDVLGRNGGALSWVFPEGSSQAPFKEFLLLQNPSSQAAQVLIRFYPANGPTVDHALALAPRSRATLDVLRDVPSLPPGQHGTVVTSTNAVPIIAEQSIYSDNFTKGDGMMGIAQ